MAILAGAIAATCSCAEPRTGPGFEDGPSLVFISLDTVRRDHLSLYGYERETTPALDALARSSTVFMDAVAQETNTNPSHTSMFTGLYPHAHGSLHNRYVLRDDQVTLAEILRDAGFRTAGFVSGVTLSARGTGLDRGFEHYDDRFERARRDGMRTTELALEWIEDRDPERRFFLFLHLYDAHGPYYPGADYAGMFVSADPGPEMDRIPDYQQLEGPLGDPITRVNPYVDRYDRLVRYQDDLVRRLLDALDLERVVVVVVSDHGESFNERYWQLDHGGQVFDEQIRIPLVIRAPGAVPRRVAEAVETVDLPPTLLELLAVPAPEGPSFQGHSLVPLIHGEARETPRATFASAEALDVRHHDRGYVLDGDRRIHCVRSGEWKLIAYPGIERDYLELYRLADDPAERVDVADSNPEKVDELFRVLSTWHEDRRLDSAGDAPELPDELLEKLRSLGYIDGG